MEFSHLTKRAYCFTCRLFASKVTYSVGRGKGDDTFVLKGYCNWKKALEKNQGFDKHQASTGHQNAVEAYRKYLTEKPLKQQIDEQHHEAVTAQQKTAKKNRETVARLFSLTRFLGRLGLPFRGHDESTNSLNRGVFRELVHYLAEHGDGVLKEHLETAPQVATYLGARSQNEVISIVGDAVRQEVIRRVKEAGKFCILMDETQDSSHTDQVSVFVRFVGLEGEHPCVQERLLALVPAECKTGEALETLLIATLEKNGLSLEDIVGQCYDGGSNMAGTYKGVQARILQKNPLALFTHCHSHNLNRVVVNSCNHKTLPEARIFFFHCWKA